MCFGAYKLKVRLVYMRRKKPDHKSIANIEKLQYPFLSSANVQTLRIKKVEPDFHFSDKKIEYISFDTPINKIEDLAACMN